MNYIKDNKVLYWIIRVTDNIVSLLIFGTIMIVIAFMGLQMYELITHFVQATFYEVLYMVALILILVKAYRLLLFYMESHHVSIKYMVEISIIAPAVELIFVAHQQVIWVNILYALFSLANLIVYIVWYKQLVAMDSDCVKDSDCSCL